MKHDVVDITPAFGDFCIMADYTMADYTIVDITIFLSASHLMSSD